MLKKSFLALCAFLACGVVATYGAADVVRAIGRGVSDKEAKQDALINAIAQHDGVSIETATKISVSQVDEAVSVNDTTDTHGTVSAAAAQDTIQKTKGKVLRYDVIRCEKEDNTRWVAELDVVFFRYETPGHDPKTRRRLVVAPFGIMQEAYPIGGQFMSARQAAGLFRDRLETFLVQSRRFTVLGRQDTDAILEEKKLILRESVDPDEYAKIFATLGTDYLLCGKIKSVSVVKGQSQNMFTDATKPKLLRAFAIVDYRILVMPTGQIKWSGEATVDLDRAQLHAMKGDESAALSALIELAAREICAQALFNIYPVRVVKIKDDGEIILNEGGELRQEGELLDAYALGDLIIDPYSKESLGREEKLVATLQVTRVEAKLSYAAIVSGDLPKELVEANKVLCRPSRAVIITEKPATEPAIKPPTASEGVRLPFDK